MTAKFLSLVLLCLFSMTGCRGGGSDPRNDTDLPTLDVTHWTDRTELFMEYPPLVAGRAALFAVHLTKLDDFKPVNAGQAKVEFTPESGGQPKVLIGPPPSR